MTRTIFTALGFAIFAGSVLVLAAITLALVATSLGVA